MVEKVAREARRRCPAVWSLMSLTRFPGGRSRRPGARARTLALGARPAYRPFGRGPRSNAFIPTGPGVGMPVPGRIPQSAPVLATMFAQQADCAQGAP